MVCGNVRCVCVRSVRRVDVGGGPHQQVARACVWVGGAPRGSSY